MIFSGKWRKGPRTVDLSIKNFYIIVLVGGNGNICQQSDSSLSVTLKEKDGFPTYISMLCQNMSNRSKHDSWGNCKSLVECKINTSNICK